jgi:hypothetical protein
MHFGRVKVGDHYSVSPEATLGLTPEKRERDKKSEQRDYKTSREIRRGEQRKREKSEQRPREKSVSD